nr:hypothetical protein [uncultured Flavonifractor sp.]
MHITEHILTNSDCYKAGRTIRPRGIMVHSTGVAQPDVNVFLKAWNKPGVDACVHAFVHQGASPRPCPGTGGGGTPAAGPTTPTSDLKFWSPPDTATGAEP